MVNSYIYFLQSLLSGAENELWILCKYRRKKYFFLPFQSHSPFLKCIPFFHISTIWTLFIFRVNYIIFGVPCRVNLWDPYQWLKSQSPILMGPSPQPTAMGEPHSPSAMGLPPLCWDTLHTWIRSAWERSTELPLNVPFLTLPIPFSL